MFKEDQITDELTRQYEAAIAAKQYAPRGGSSLNLQEGDEVTVLEGQCPLRKGELPSAEGPKMRAWSTCTLKVVRGGTTMYLDGVSTSNLTNGSIAVGVKKGDKTRVAISSLRPRLGTRGSVLTSSKGVPYIPEDTYLGKAVAAGDKILLADDFKKGVATVALKAPKDPKSYCYIP